MWAAVTSIESRIAIASGSKEAPKPLSVQQGLDCARYEYMREIGKGKLLYRSSRGCQTGFPGPIIQYAIDEGYMLAEDYPVKYDPNDSFIRDKSWSTESCQVDTGRVLQVEGGKLKKISRRKGKFEERLIEALAKGPVAVGIDKTSYQVGLDQDVRSGNIATKDCPSHNGDHAVTVVGYGSLDGKAFWLIKNSWGRSWGDNGLFKVPRGVNFCGVESTAAYLEVPPPEH